jgi:hypothetical protein
MTNVSATWLPYWYELDAPIAVGERSSFAFDADAASAGRFVFSNGPSEPGRSEERVVTIFTIAHPRLGAISRVETKGLVYRVVLADGTELLVEAEEGALGQIFSVSDKRWAHVAGTTPEWRLEVTVQLEGADGAD